MLKKLGFIKIAEVYKDPVTTKTKKRLLRKDKVTEVVQPDVARSFKNTGFNDIRKDHKINVQYAALDTTFSKKDKYGVDDGYDVTHRYIGENQAKIPKSFKYLEKVRPAGFTGAVTKTSVGGTYDLAKNIQEIQDKKNPPSYWEQAKRKVTGWFK